MTEADPVSEFLSREQEDMAALGLEDSPNPPPTDDIFQGEEEVSGQEPVGNGAVENGHAGEDEGLEDFMGTPEPVAAAPEPPAPEPKKPAAPAGPRVEPETIRKWRVEFTERLAAKDAKEKEAIKKLKEDAKKQMADFEKNRQDGLAKKKKENRTSEAEFCALRDAKGEGKEWERIARLCEFNPKNSKNQKDLNRMRNILLQKKTEKVTLTPEGSVDRQLQLPRIRSGTHS